MAINASDLLIRLLVDSKGVDKGLNSAKKSLSSFGKDLKTGVFQGIGQEIFRGVTRAASVAVGEIGKSIKAASDLSESINKIGVVFGDAGQEMLAWSEDAATSMGQSRQQALEAAASFGNLFVAMGLGRKEAADMSRELVELASDIASINNLEPEVALEKLRAGLVGETEPLRTVGVLLNEAAVTAKAAALGFGDTSKELTEAEKVLARYNLILEQTTLAQGDFDRTAGGAANQMRIFQAQMTDLRGELGQAFTPAVSEVLQGLNELIRTVRPYGENLITSFVVGLTRAINTQVIPVLSMLRGIFVYWLKPGSPPRLLPEIDEWGKRAMEEYLRGWTTADLGILEDLGRSLESVIRSFAGAGKIGETDLVSRVFGTRQAILAAIAEFRRAGDVSEQTLDAIARAAGPAGGAVRELTRAYFDLESATRDVSRAQEDLLRVTEAYDRRLDPLNDQLAAINDQQAALADQKRLRELQFIQADIFADPAEKQAAALEAQQIAIEAQRRAIEAERRDAVGAAEDKVAAAEKEQEAKQEVYDAQQAAVQQQLDANRLIEEETALRERLANEALAAQEKALRELEAAQREMQQADEKRRAELERIYQATLDYNLQLADTPGKIALLKLELKRYAEGSAEYYGILTQIASLEQQLAKERETGGAGAAPPLAMLEDAKTEAGKVKQEFIDLAEAVENAFAIIMGKNEQDWGRHSLLAPPVGAGDFTVPEAPPSGLPTWLEDLLDTLKGIPGAMDELKASIGELSEPLSVLVGWLEKLNEQTGGGENSETGGDPLRLDELSDLMRVLAESLGLVPPKADDAGESVSTFRRVVGDVFPRFSTLVGENTDIANASIESFGKTVTDTGDQATKDLSTDLGEQEKAVTDSHPRFKTAGEGLTTNLFGGMKFAWTTEHTWWKVALQWIRDMLPGSEPKDVDSPLRGLKDAGGAIIQNLFDGMKFVWDTIVQPWWEGVSGIWGQFRDFLPGSEPKNPNSPLRDLGKAGEALIGNIQAGMERASLSLTPSMASGLVGAATSNTNHISLVVNVTGGGSGIGDAARNGVLDALRQAGLR